MSSGVTVMDITLSLLKYWVGSKTSITERSGCWFAGSMFSNFEIGLLRNVSKSMLADQSKSRKLKKFGVDKKRVNGLRLLRRNPF